MFCRPGSERTANTSQQHEGNGVLIRIILRSRLAETNRKLFLGNKGHEKPGPLSIRGENNGRNKNKNLVRGIDEFPGGSEVPVQKQLDHLPATRLGGLLQSRSPMSVPRRDQLAIGAHLPQQLIGVALDRGRVKSVDRRLRGEQ